MKSLIINPNENILNPFATKHKEFSVIGGYYAGFHRTYGVKIEWVVNEKKQTLQQQVGMMCFRKEEKIIWEINKKHFFVNDYKSENPFVEMAIAYSQLLYPIQVQILNGSVHSIANQKEIRDRFEQGKLLLQRDFGGTLSHKYMHQMEDALQQQEQLLKIIKQDIWFSLFFVPIQGRYDNYEKDLAISLPFEGYKQPLSFIGKASAPCKATPWNTHTVTFKGAFDIEKIPLYMKYDYQEGTLEATYDLDINTHHIQNIIAEVNLNTAKGIYSLKIRGYKIDEDLEECISQQKLKEKPDLLRRIFGA